MLLAQSSEPRSQWRYRGGFSPPSLFSRDGHLDEYCSAEATPASTDQQAEPSPTSSAQSIKQFSKTSKITISWRHQKPRSPTRCSPGVCERGRRSRAVFYFEELTDETRAVMLREFEAEQREENPYRSNRLSDAGLEVFPGAMRNAIVTGNEESLEDELIEPDFWWEWETYERGGVTHERQINFEAAARSLAITEFNTWYVRGLAKRLIDEGLESCEVYRAEDARERYGGCPLDEGSLLSLEEVYDGHRARYWPWPGNPDALSIPAHPNCHYTIRRTS